MIHVLDASSQITFLSPSVLQTLGYSGKADTSQSFLEGVHPEDRKDVELALQRTREFPGRPQAFAFRLKHQNGAWRDLETIACGLPAAEGREAEIVLNSRDVSDRLESEKKTLVLSRAIEQSAEAVVITDTRGTIEYVNPAFEQITGYSVQEAIGQNPRVLKSGRHDPEFYKRLWNTIANGKDWRGRIINRHKDGHLIEEEVTLSPVRDADGRIAHYVAVKRDVTREVQLEEQLRQSQKMEAIGQLAGGVAHDFNNLLTSMIMQADLTRGIPDLPEEAQEALKEIQTAAGRAANLTRQLLLFSRRQAMEPVELDLNEIVRNLSKMLGRIIGETIQVELRLSPEPLRVRADAGMMDQILLNLCINARDAMPAGGRLVIETTVAESGCPPRQEGDEALPPCVLLRVSDTGTGIRDEDLAHIFEPFFTTKGVGKGTGLGLATVFGIVKQHGGKVDVRTRPNEGTTFEVRLPALKEPVAAAGRRREGSVGCLGREWWYDFVAFDRLGHAWRLDRASNRRENAW